MIDPATLRWEAFNSFGLQAGFDDNDDIILYRYQINKIGTYIYFYDSETIDDLISSLPVVNEYFRGKFPNKAALDANIFNPPLKYGDYAQVDAGPGSDVINYSWDADDNIWIEGGSGSGATTTDELPEGIINLYFENARVLATTLLGLAAGTNTNIVSSDTILEAFAKIQNQINSKFTLPILTSGSILFSNGTTISQDNASLFWDIVNKRLGLNKTTPISRLEIEDNTIGNTPIESSGIVLSNNGTANPTTVRNSPSLIFSGYSYNTGSGTAPYQNKFEIVMIGQTGSSTTSGYLSIRRSLSGGAYTEIARVTNTGLLITGTIDVSSTVRFTGGATVNSQDHVRQLGGFIIGTVGMDVPSASLIKMVSTTRGFLASLMTSAQKNAISSTTVNDVQITNGGGGYTTATVSFIGGGATTQATGTVTLSSGVVTAINLTTFGIGYTSAPTVIISGNGSGATATAYLLPTGNMVIDRDAQRPSFYTQNGWKNVAYTDDMKYGSATIVMNGTDTVFNIPHGLGVNPSSIAVTFEDASNLNFVQSVRTKDATNIIFTCMSPPAAGTAIVYWQVYR